jgi:hypothetical protein
VPRSKSWASPGGVAPIEPKLNLEINHDNSTKENSPGRERTKQRKKEGTEGGNMDAHAEPILVRGEQTGHYPGRGELQLDKDDDKRKTQPEPTLVNGEQNGHYIGRVGKMEEVGKDKSRQNEKPRLRQPTLKWPTNKGGLTEEKKEETTKEETKDEGNWVK